VRISYFSGCALSICVATAFLAGCGGSQAPVTVAPVTATTQATHTRPAITFQTLHSFGSNNDGESPESALIEVNGTLYGTTPLGGLHDFGTVYSISKTGTETVLHSFSGPDGDSPGGGALLDVNGTLDGTTRFGGAHGKGTVYTIDATGNENVVHSFDGDNGAHPDGALISKNDALYGTTTYGGRYDRGIVYVKRPYRFFKGHDFGLGYDGASPTAGLTNVNGDPLFGTTIRGGVADGGTVYSLFNNGTEQVVHYFGLGSDGKTPFAGVLGVKGTLYGTTNAGGAHGRGTVYRIAQGVETVLHSFGGGSDGKDPIAGVTEMNGELYGTTELGGAHDEGTVYRISTTGAETVVYSFGSGDNDGRHPYAGLLKINDTLYGTTTSGGMAGWGTVFSLKP
jgi:uncharacterized repeat protein (TIGR03803 family)